MQSASVNEGYATDLNFFMTAPLPQTCTLNTADRTVTICTPTNNATVNSPVHIVAGSTDSSPVTKMQVFVDGIGGYSVSSTTLNTYVSMALGTRRVTVLATDAAGTFKQTIYVTVVAPATLTPASITFSGQTTTGSTSSPQSATLTAGSTALTISAITTTGDFSQTNNCGTSLAAGATCTINVTFAPSAPGARTGTLNVADSDLSSPQTLALNGTGANVSNVSLTPNSLTFGIQNVNTTSAAQVITLANNNTSNLTSIAVSTSGDYAQANNCGLTVVAGGSCAINVTFKPTAAGTRTGTIAVSDSDAGSPQIATLTGTGAAVGCTPGAVNPSVTICAPLNNATVTSPVHVSASTTDSNPVTVLQIYVDGSPVYTVKTGSLEANVSLATGSHRLTVLAKDSTGLIFKQSIVVNAQ
jgi:hypothetical protein